MGRKNNDDIDSDEPQDNAMADAFRQLESLESLEEPIISPPLRTSTTSTTSLKMGIDRVESVEPPSIETEAKVYQDYLQEVEVKSEFDLYEDLLTDMGGSVSSSWAPPLSRSSSDETPSPSSPTRPSSNEDFLNQALQEAMEEVKLNNPSISESLLDDDVFKKEVEAIFDKGNEQLLASLEEIRQEQVRVTRGRQVFTSRMNLTINRLWLLRNSATGLGPARTTMHKKRWIN
jgi:hypothetical protein